jgi:hypothetical protein
VSCRVSKTHPASRAAAAQSIPPPGGDSRFLWIGRLQGERHAFNWAVGFSYVYPWLNSCLCVLHSEEQRSPHRFFFSGHAPLSKVILFGTAGISLLVSLTNQKNRWAMVPLSEIISKHQWWRLFSNVWFLTTPGEMLFGILLIYYFRMFERQMGTPRFAVRLVLTTYFRVLCTLPLRQR